MFHVKHRTPLPELFAGVTNVERQGTTMNMGTNQRLSTKLSTAISTGLCTDRRITTSAMRSAGESLVESQRCKS